MTNENENDQDAPWSIETDEDAAWAVHKVAQADADVARAKEQARAYVDRVKAEAERTKRFFSGHLEAWYLENPPKRGRHIKTPAGRFGYRKKPAGLFWEKKADAVDRCLAWAEENAPELIETVVARNVPAAAAKAYFARTGEIPDGMEAREGEDVFEVKAAPVAKEDSDG